LRRVRFAFQRVDGDPFIRQAEPVADPLHLQVVARVEIAVIFVIARRRYDSIAAVEAGSVNRPPGQARRCEIRICNRGLPALCSCWYRPNP
jgi:hypothetical protein